MKRRLVYISIGIGLIPWIWVGSYAAFRLDNTGDVYLTCFVFVPKWAKPLSKTYRPLAKLDTMVTGTHAWIFPNHDSVSCHPPLIHP